MRRFLLPAAAVTLAGVAAVVVVLLFRGGEELTRGEYTARIKAICEEYDAKLRDVPSPVGLANSELIAQSVDRALTLIRERGERYRAVPVPDGIDARVATLFARSGEAMGRLEAAREAARAGKLRESAAAVGEFVSLSHEAERLARELGIEC